MNQLQAKEEELVKKNHLHSSECKELEEKIARQHKETEEKAHAHDEKCNELEEQLKQVEK